MISSIVVLPENSASMLPSREIIVHTLVLFLSSCPLILISLIARASIPYFVSVWLNVNLFPFSPIFLLAIKEIPLPSTLAFEESFEAFNIE